MVKLKDSTSIVPLISKHLNPYENLSQTAGYDDMLVTPSNLPSMSIFYYFEKDLNNNPNIYFCFNFNPGSYQADQIIQEQCKPDDNDCKQNVINACKKNAAIDVEDYIKLVYQLRQPDVKVSFATTVDSNTSHQLDDDEKVNFINYLTGICNFLELVTGGNFNNTVTTEYTISSPISALNFTNIYRLIVTFSVQRDISLVAPDFKNVQGIASVTSEVKPFMRDVTGNDLAADGSTPPISLNDFAQKFEIAFSDTQKNITLKIATSIKGNNISNIKLSKTIWVARFGVNGITYTVSSSQPYFFAPVPLSNIAISLNASIFAYSSEKGLDTSSPFTYSFSGIDLDSWGKIILSAIDDFLTPEYSMPAAIINNAAYNNILKSKGKIAEAIAINIDFVLDSQKQNQNNSVKPPSIADAQEKIKQQLLIELSSMYSMDAIVQHNVFLTFANTPGAGSAKLLGTLIIQSAKPNLRNEILKDKSINTNVSVSADEYSVSAADIHLQQGDSWLTYLFSAKNPEQHHSMELKLQYIVNNIEYQTESVQGIQNSSASSLLNFVIPIDNLSYGLIGDVEIPVILRSYPTFPVVTEQIGGSSFSSDNSKDNCGGESLNVIQKAMKWNYEYTFNQVASAQDIIQTLVEFNLTSKPQPAVNSIEGDPPLDIALARFILVYPQIKTDFDNALSKVNENTKAADKIFKTAQNAIKAFDYLVGNAADVWEKWNGKAIGDESLKNEQQGETYSLSILEKSEQNTNDLQIEINLIQPYNGVEVTYTNVVGVQIPNSGFASDPDPSPLTSGSITYKFKDNNGNYLKYNDRENYSQRTIIFGCLDILLKQNSRAGVSLTRNKHLLNNFPDEITSDVFIYQTPIIKFPNKLIPLLINNSLIDIAKISALSAQNRPLAQHLNVLFSQIFAGIPPGKQIIKVGCEYIISLQERKTFNNIYAPVLLTVPFNFNVPDDLQIGIEPDYCQNPDSFVCKLKEIMSNWFYNNNPSQADGTFLMNITVYSADDTILPLVKLENLVLSLSNITDISL
jgi:hypothetical protein